jgi:hypothetical protein
MQAANIPLPPIMGGQVPGHGGDLENWTGGKPLANWTGLHADAPLEPTENQKRPTYSGTAQKSYNYRKSGLKNEFKKGGDLQLFQKALLKHFVDVGIDTITYLPHPSDPDRMESVIKYHASFSLETVTEHVGNLQPLWDGFDRSNDKAATECLLASLETTLYETIEKKVREDDTFTMVWMRFMATIQSTSYDHFETLKTSEQHQGPQHHAVCGPRRVSSLRRLQSRCKSLESCRCL